MTDITQYFSFDLSVVQIKHFYVYFVFAAAVAFYLTFKSNSKYKIELFFVSFYLLTGNLNDVLTIKIPGISFFEIQPIRFIFFLLSFFIIRKTLFSSRKLQLTFNKKMPWFEVALLAYVVWQTLSILINILHVGIPSGIKTILDAVAFLVIISALRLMADKPSYDLIGKVIIVGAIITSIVSFIQLGIDPYFLRVGSDRPAFGSVLRSNGIFNAEYYNSYYLIMAIAWTLTTVKKNGLKIALICLFSLGVITSFMRMSWIILALVLVTYLIFINKIAIEKLLLVGLAGLAIILSISIFYYQDIVNSTIVKERLSDSVDGRKGYYKMVFDHIGEEPVFGFVDFNHEFYYVTLLRITSSRDRATGAVGSLHNGYFSALFLYGVPACAFFTLFVLLSVFYYSRSFKKNLYFVIPFLAGIIYMIGNLTNTFLFISYLSVLYAVHIGIGMGMQRIEEKSIFLDQETNV